jgi:nucleotide-binding universal stress UspA family protein
MSSQKQHAPRSNLVVAGVDGGPSGLRAAEYAAFLAQEHGLSVRLIHAYHVVAAVAPAMVPLASADTFRSIGLEALRAAAERAHDAAPGVEVETELALGSAPAVLINASKHAELVVVGRSPIHGVERVLSGSTSTPVAARAWAPVVAVPEGWKGPVGAENGRGVVVGTDGSTQGRAALALAFDEAARRHVPLTAVRVWGIPPAWAFDVVHLTNDEEWREEAQVSLGEDLAGHLERYPDLPVTPVVERSTSIARSLLQHACGADLLVIGARGHGGVPGLDMGMVARSVLAHADVPVAVVHRGDLRAEQVPAGGRVAVAATT